MMGVTVPALAIGSSPYDPIPFDARTGAIELAFSDGGEIWLEADFIPSSRVSHLALQTEGDLDTRIAVFANLSEALEGIPIGEDDDNGLGSNESLQVPLGFPSPYLIRATASRSGSSRLRAELIFVPSDRCDWPPGCSLAIVARGAPQAAEMLQLLREVRSKVLLQSQRGQDLIELYWKLSKDLSPDLLADDQLRQRAYQTVQELLPLAREAIEAVRGTGGRTNFSRTHFEKLRELMEIAAPRLSMDLETKLRSHWQEFALEGHVGQPLAKVLADLGLLVNDKPHRIIAKLRFDPVPELVLGKGRFQTGNADLDAHFAAAGVQSIRRVHADSPTHRSAGLTKTIVIEVDSLYAAQDLVAQLKSHTSIQWAQVSGKLRALVDPLDADPFREDLWGLDAIRAPTAWTATAGTCSTLVAVVDTGLRDSLADFEGRALQQFGYDFVDDDPVPEDEHGHGTHVAGTIAAAVNNSISIAGVAPGICLVGVKVLGDDGAGTAEGVAAGIVHSVDVGAQVINLSLGCDCETQEVIEEALAYAAMRDVVVVAAAGNDSVDELHYPAASTRTIAVGALDSTLELASFSNYGAGLDVVAPGVDVVSLFRDGESCTGSGTSMAAPHVAGVASLVRSLIPSLDREETTMILRQTARDLGPPGYDTIFGAGLVDAFNAVEAARTKQVPPDCTSTTTAICLNDGRFRVEAFWHRADGASGLGKAIRLTADTGYFWFFDNSNVEVVVKVLDACTGANNRFWVFAAGLTNVGVRLRISDTVTGRVKEYVNPLNKPFQPVQDTNAFATCNGVRESPASEGTWNSVLSTAPRSPLGRGRTGRSVRLAFGEVGNTSDSDLAPGVEEVNLAREGEELHSIAASHTCTEAATGMCLSDDRFRVEAFWRRPEGEQRQGKMVRITPNTGYFWFFNKSNVEVVVKILNACGTGSNHFWVFAAGLTNVEVHLRITDTVTGRIRDYFSPLNVPYQPILDTRAFATCP